MSKLGIKALGLALTLSCTGAPFLTGCSSSGESHEKAEHGGSVKLALKTTGADGATYAFPQDAYLVVQGPTYTEYLWLYGDETTFNRTLAAGTYTATLYFYNGPTVLEKTQGANTTTVDATWTNPQPVTFTIVDGQTTPIALHFTVKGLGDVSFETGTLAVTADVQKENSATFASAAFTGVTNLYYSRDTDATAQYATSLHLDQGVDYPLTLSYTSTSPWAQANTTQVCQSGTLSVASSSGSAALNARLEQMMGSSVYFCVGDNGANDYVGIYSNKYGPPPASQVSFLPDANYGVAGGISFTVGDVYDSTTLHQTALQNVTFMGGSFYHELFDGSWNELTMVAGYASGTFTMTP